MRPLVVVLADEGVEARRGQARLRIKLAARQGSVLELLVVGVILATMLILSSWVGPVNPHR
jgi:hypothetical protein